MCAVLCIFIVYVYYVYIICLAIIENIYREYTCIYVYVSLPTYMYMYVLFLLRACFVLCGASDTDIRAGQCVLLAELEAQIKRKVV